MHPDETHADSAAYVLAHACDQLSELLGNSNYRRGVLARFARERSEGPF